MPINFANPIPTKFTHIVRTALFGLLIGYGTLLQGKETKETTWPLFVLPDKWEVIDPSSLPASLKIGFIKRDQDSPITFNVASERVAFSTEEYVKKVKHLHGSHPSMRLRDLGEIETLSGKGHLLEIETKTPSGMMRLLQMVLVKDGRAYVVTGGAPLKQFSKHYGIFDRAFHSFTITEDLFTIVSADKRASLQEQLNAMVSYLQKGKNPLDSFEQKLQSSEFQNRFWKPFVKEAMPLSEEFENCWLVYVINHLKQKLHGETGQVPSAS